MASVSVVIPVKNGARYLEALLAAVTRERPDEILVMDSGSTDASRAITANAGARVVHIPSDEFGHGRTRNLALEHTTGDLLCFLTQDAVPVPGWRAAYAETFARPERIGAAYGPHLPRADTSPMIARELEQFFRGMSEDQTTVLHGPGDLTFLSNVNACYLRECLEEIRFADVEYAEDQAFGIAMLAAGWMKAYVPAAAVEHAHDYGPLEFTRRYFDEARGLSETQGHSAPVHPGEFQRRVSTGVREDLRFMRANDYAAPNRVRWGLRSALHHASRFGAEALGTRHTRLPDAAQRALSLEGRASAPLPEPAVGAPRGRPVAGGQPATYPEILELWRNGGATALAPTRPGNADRERLHLAFVVPPYARGSGGHSTLFNTIRRLEKRGHTCTIWIHDPLGKVAGRPASVLRQEIRNWFAPVRAPVFVGFADWHGADVAVATGWDTAHATALLEGCGARAYFIQDHEPEFYPTSAESGWAEETYSLGLFPICASPWLRDIIAERHDSHGVSFLLGVDHDTYKPGLLERRDDTVIVYARGATARRAVPLVILALEELVRRRPQTRVVVFGQYSELGAPFPYELLGVATPGQLALNYCEATVGVCLSLTNYSLIPQEMMACGLPCVDIAGASSEAVFGSDGPAELCERNPVAIAEGIASLLDDEARWRHRSEAGLQFVADADWELATDQIEAGLRQALREREPLT